MIELLFVLAHGLMLAGPSVGQFASRAWKARKDKKRPAEDLSIAVKVHAEKAPLSSAWSRYAGARPEPRGEPRDSVLALDGYQRFRPEDWDAFFEVTEALGISADALWMVIRHESRGDATALNAEPAAGLIQLTTYAKLPGYETKDKIRAVIKLAARDQLLGPVKQYYARAGAAVRGATPGELLLYNFTPSFMGKPESTVISRRGEDIYDKNYKAFDLDAKGSITVGDVYKKAERILAEAGGRRVTRNGLVIDASGAPASSPPAPASPPPAAPSSATKKPTKPIVALPKPVMSLPAPPKKVEIKTAPTTEAPSATDPTPMSAPAPKPAPSADLVGGAKGNPIGAIGGALGGAASAVLNAGNAGNAGGSGSAASSVVSGLVGGLAGNPASPAKAGGGDLLGSVAGSIFGAVQGSSQAAGGSGLLGDALGSLSSLVTAGEPLSPSHDVRGILLAAARDHALDPIGWTWVTVPGADLDVYVPNDAFKTTLGETPGVRAPVTYAELRELCRLLGCVPATRAIVDAMYLAALAHTKPVGLVQKPGDDKRMNTVGFVLTYHEAIEKQLRAAKVGAEALIEPVGKWWIVDPKLGTSRHGARAACNYGWFQSSVSDPIQKPSGAHDDDHSDYSQLARAVHRYARRTSSQEEVDLLDVYAATWPEIKPFIDVLR